MGLSLTAARFFVGESKRRIDFSKTLIVGRQSIYMLPNEYKSVCALGNIRHSFFGIFADEFFSGLGAKQLNFLDSSAYEGAGIIHDLNFPISNSYFNKWSCVIDAGSLEHVFNFPEAIRNLMELVQIGGHLLLVTPWNNFAGHGFYQFSPELFYRVLCPTNGFEIERMLIFRRGRWFAIPDPQSLGKRVEAWGSDLLELHISAKRIKKMPIFSQWPQQSDYIRAWLPASSSKRENQGFVKRLKVLLISWWPFLEKLQILWRNYRSYRMKKVAFFSSIVFIAQKNKIPI